MLSFASRLMTGRSSSWMRSALFYSSFRPTITSSYFPASSDKAHVSVSPPVSSVTTKLSDILKDHLASLSVWWIKRTFQPSLLRKKRKHGYLKRSQSPGGRKILRRRKAKGRARLFGA